MQKILNFCARVVTGRRKYDRVSGVFSELQWFTAKELVYYHRVCFVHNVIKTGQPEDIAVTVGETANQRHDHDTRRAGEITLPRIHNNAGRRRLCYSVIQDYNRLPIATHDPGFRQRLRNHMLRQAASAT